MEDENDNWLPDSNETLLDKIVINYSSKNQKIIK